MPRDPNKVEPGTAGCGNVEASNIVSGTIIDRTWRLADSPYLVGGDIRVAGLTIEAGVQVEFLGDYVFEVAGTLTAVGTAASPIMFTREAGNTTGWQGILFNMSSSASRLEYCTVEGSVNSGIRVVNSLPTIAHCSITNNEASQGGGLHIDLTSLAAGEELLILGSTISDNTSTGNAGGIRANLGSAVLRLEGCQIANNISNPTQANGNFVGGGIYSTATDGRMVLNNCQLVDNASYSKCTGWNCTVTNYGGGIYADGNLDLTNSIIRGNLAWAIDGATGGGERNYSYGAGIYQYAGALTAVNCIISHNQGNPSGSHPYPYGAGILSEQRNRRSGQLHPGVQ